MCGLTRGVAAPRSPASAATATAAPTAAGSGVSGSTCSAPPTGSRSLGSSPHRPRADRRRRAAPARPADPARPCSATKGSPGAEFEGAIRLPRATCTPGPQRPTTALRQPGGIRQWMESTFDTPKPNSRSERHGGRTLRPRQPHRQSGLLALPARRQPPQPAHRQPQPQPHRLRPMTPSPLPEELFRSRGMTTNTSGRGRGRLRGSRRGGRSGRATFELVEPGEGALDHPAVAAEPGAVLGLAASDFRFIRADGVRVGDSRSRSHGRR